jgi:hypothetical protein
MRKAPKTGPGKGLERAQILQLLLKFLDRFLRTADLFLDEEISGLRWGLKALVSLAVAAVPAGLV